MSYAASISSHLRTSIERFGQGWNAFWFTPSEPHPAAVLRVVVGLAATWWLLTFCLDLERFFGPQGLFPSTYVRDVRPGPAFSILDYVRGSAFLWSIHAAAILVAALFAVGFATRITAVLSLLIVLSYIWRAPNLASDAEDILALLLFYLTLSPCGAVFSVDAWLARRRGKPTSAASQPGWPSTLPLRLIQVHVCIIYAVMALAKLRGVVWLTGEGVWWMAARPESRLIDLTWLHPYPDLIAAWTHAIVAFELLFPLLIWNRTARPLFLAFSVVHWLGLMLLTGNILFCLLMLAAGVAFVSPKLLAGILGHATQ